MPWGPDDMPTSHSWQAVRRAGMLEETDISAPGSEFPVMYGDTHGYGFGGEPRRQESPPLDHYNLGSAAIEDYSVTDDWPPLYC